MNKLNLSKDQEIVLDALLEWNSSGTQNYLTVGGYAGTGKTTLISIFREKLAKEKKTKKIRVAFCSYTGKAARVLRDKINDHGVLRPGDSVGTIHSLIYSPVVNEREEIVGWELKDALDTDLIIVDEASMVDQKIWVDLNSFGIPIVAVGDHGQLAPIKGDFNLVQKPHLKLEKIHRQAEGNAIIQLSILARNEGRIPVGVYGEKVIKYDNQDDVTNQDLDDILMDLDRDTLVLCGYNNTRVRLNRHIRQMHELGSDLPEAGDKVICLRNNHEVGIYNGMAGEIVKIMDENEDWYYAEIDLGEGESMYKGLIYKDQFGSGQSLNFTDQRTKLRHGDLFDFGYAVTVHKAQGSQAKRVVLIEERFSKMTDEMWRRWLYTAITRAEEELYIFGR